MERRGLARWGTIGAGGAIVLASLVGSASAGMPTPTLAPIAVRDACADANGDGALGVTDGVQALRAAVGLASTCTPYRCDVDGSGNVTVTDGVGVLERAAGILVPEVYECPVRSRVQDFSAFGAFRFWRESEIFGFCAPIGGVLSAEVRREAGGGYVLRLDRAALRPLGDPECLYPTVPTPDGMCVAPASAVERVMTSDELARLRALFAIEVFEDRSPICQIVAFDPCISNAMSFDGFEVRSDSCRAPWVDGTDMGDIVNLLDELAPPP